MVYVQVLTLFLHQHLENASKHLRVGLEVLDDTLPTFHPEGDITNYGSPSDLNCLIPSCTKQTRRSTLNATRKGQGVFAIYLYTPLYLKITP